MNRYRMQMATKWWSPKLNATMIKLLRSLRHRKQLREQHLMDVTVQGADRVRQLLADHAVLITPNHPTHADPYSIYAASDAVGVPFYLMTAWQVFADTSWIGRQIMRWHGCFSVDREATDMRAFRQAVALLEDRPEPLVIFPEGEVYHCNARVRPFREGAAVIALTAAKRAKRPVACVPCALWYEYLGDPSEELSTLMSDLENQIFWRPRGHLPLHDRIYRFAETALVVKEMEFLGKVGEGPLPPRVTALAERVLQDVEQRHDVTSSGSAIPERVKEMRRRAIEGLEQEGSDEDTRHKLKADLEDLFLVVQLYSYPGDYVSEKPSIERMAETLDKLEEDVLDRFSATVRGQRRSTVAFGDPILVEPTRDRKKAMTRLTESFEEAVQDLIDRIGNFSPATSDATSVGYVRRNRHARD